MLKLVESSQPNAVAQDAAIRHLTERAVLTRAVCRELFDAQPDFSTRRPCIALFLLLQWIRQNRPQFAGVEPYPADGLDAMPVPEGCRDLFQEVSAGAEVCHALFLLLTADNSLQAVEDKRRLQNRLHTYWEKHEHSIRAPSLID